MTTLEGPEAAQFGAPEAPNGPGLAPGRFEELARIIEEVEALPIEHPDSIAVRHAVAGLYKSVKVRRRTERRAKVLAHDDAVTSKTATGAPGRIDDETAGLPLAPASQGAIAGVLLQPRGCYV